MRQKVNILVISILVCQSFVAWAQSNMLDAPTIQALLNAAQPSCGQVQLPAGTYPPLDRQLTVPPCVRVTAYGAVLKWTSFGSNQTELSGNGIRLSSNTEWRGGKLQAALSERPTLKSGEFGNQVVIGHFGSDTSEDMSIATENVYLENVDFELLSGFRNTGVLVAGLSRHIRIRNVTDTHTSADTSDMAFLEATWGGSSSHNSICPTTYSNRGCTYHPHDVLLENLTLNEYVDSGYQASARGVHISGCYDVTVRNLTVTNSIYPLTFYIGDPGDPGGGTSENPQLSVNVSQVGRIATNYVLDGFSASKFNIGLRVLGDARGSTSWEHSTHSVRVNARQLSLTGLGPIIPQAGLWLSNAGVQISQAENVVLTGGEISSVYDGIVGDTIRPEDSYTALHGIVIVGLHIHDTARDGINFNGSVIGATIGWNTIHDVGKDTSQYRRAAVRYSGMYNLITNNVLGRGADATTVYGVLTEPAQPGKADDGHHNLLIGNTICSPSSIPYDGAGDWLNLSSGNAVCP